jgi:hypothetical protein
LLTAFRMATWARAVLSPSAAMEYALWVSMPRLPAVLKLSMLVDRKSVV